MAGLFGAARRLPQVDPAAMGVTTPQPYEDVRFPQAAPQQQRQGGGTKRIVGILGDALLGLAGQQGQYGPMMHQRRMLEARDAAARQQAEQQRQWGREDKLWEWQNKPPAPNDTERDYEFWRQRLSPEDFETWKRNKVDPPVWRQGADEQWYRVDTPRAPTRPVGKLTPIEPMSAPSGGGGNFMTPAQFQAIAAQKGQAWAENWARQNNIQVRN